MKFDAVSVAIMVIVASCACYLLGLWLGVEVAR